MIGGGITKITILPVCNWGGDPGNAHPEQLKKKRYMLERGNACRSWLALISVVVMACQLSVEWTAIAVVSCVVIAPPSLWLADNLRTEWHAPLKRRRI